MKRTTESPYLPGLGDSPNRFDQNEGWNLDMGLQKSVDKSDRVSLTTTNKKLKVASVVEVAPNSNTTLETVTKESILAAHRNLNNQQVKTLGSFSAVKNPDGGVIFGHWDKLNDQDTSGRLMFFPLSEEGQKHCREMVSLFLENQPE